METEPLKKSGLVAIVGRSNVGKSTLMNSLIGTKIAITSPKPQTTRHTIHGVLHDERGQAVFVDTPGIFAQIPDTLTAKLNQKAADALTGIDLVLYVVDPTRHIGKEDEIIHRIVTNSSAPKILVINKSDIRGEFIDEFMAWEKEFTSVIQISARKEHNLKALKDLVFEALPIGEPLYPTDRITDSNQRFWISELVREKIFLALHEEIPYTTTVETDEIVERENGMIYVKARILTTSSRYKKMIIGQGGRQIKTVGSNARKEIEAVTGKKVFLELEVEVEEKWQERFE